jgi:hypothetical protein
MSTLPIVIETLYYVFRIPHVMFSYHIIHILVFNIFTLHIFTYFHDYSGDEIENSGVVDLRRNDGLSSKNAGIASDADSRKKNDVRNKKGNSDESEMNSDDDEEEGGSELESIIESEKRKTDDAYRAGESESRDRGS